MPHRWPADPVLEADSHAKVQMRKKIRGLRGIERSVLKRRRDATPDVTEIGASPAARKAEASDGGAMWSWTTAPSSAASSTTTKVARCIQLWREDGSIPAAERDALAGSYSGRAVESLRDAVRKGFLDANRLKTASTYEPLRQRGDFRRLVLEVEERSDDR